MPFFPSFRASAVRGYVSILMVVITIAGGCGESPTAPKPTPEGQTAPGTPDASGIPKPPLQGGAR